jgi:hypothetical protein
MKGKLPHSRTIISDTFFPAPFMPHGMRFLTEHAFTGEYLSRFRVQSDDMRGARANGPPYHGSLPSACRNKAIIPTCSKIII